jgi:hypothetical protein
MNADKIKTKINTETEGGQFLLFLYFHPCLSALICGFFSFSIGVPFDKLRTGIGCLI